MFYSFCFFFISFLTEMPSVHRACEPALVKLETLPVFGSLTLGRSDRIESENKNSVFSRRLERITICGNLSDSTEAFRRV